ncbi:MAG: glycosyltransferase [Dysgonamonadaceae bacterium]|jgi:glycosyltransferase involved in cell wall biosynthesis|nr:glycosyltransferase [Dysgonamonadaceae bacterium]
MRKIVVSGINFFAGGPLKVMQAFLESLSEYAKDEYEIIALVHDEKLFPHYEHVQYLAFKNSRKSWLFRMYYEYLGFRRLSRKLKPYCWISLHDISPNVSAERRILYCQNSYPFYSPGIQYFWIQPRIYLFSLLSKQMYRINIKKNDFVVVQQEWLRKAFGKMFGLDRDKIVVALPMQSTPRTATEVTGAKNKRTLFLFPARPMINKNFEILCKATALLEKAGVADFKVVITIDGKENRYTRHLYKKYGRLKSLQFVGLLDRDAMHRHFLECDCVVFPSKIETWGLPVSEAKEYGKPVLISDLPYAKETVGVYDKAKFFNPDNPPQLAQQMSDFIADRIVYDPTEEIKYEEPFAADWKSLFDQILK